MNYLRQRAGLQPLCYGVLISAMFCSNVLQSQNLWAVRIGGSGDDRCTSVAVDNSGNVYATGWFAGTVDFDPGTGTSNLTSSGSWDIFVTKLNSSGSLVWAKKLGGSNNDVANSIAVDASGNVYTTGYFEGTADFDPGTGTYNLTSPGGNSDIFISKLDASGNFVWAKKIGDTSWEEGLSLCIAPDGGIIVTGYYGSTCDFDPGTGTSNLTNAGMFDVFVCKLTSGGIFVWAKNVSGSSDETGTSVTTDATGNVYVTGWFKATPDFDPGAGTTLMTSAGFKDVFVLKLNSSGNLTWAKKFGGTQEDEGFSVKVDASGNVHTTGCFTGLVDFDPGPSSSPITSAGYEDAFISKLDASGNFVWAKQLGSAGTVRATSLCLDNSGNIHTTGYFYDATDFDPGTGTANLSPAGNCDVYISKLSSAGSYLYAYKMGGSSFDYGNSIFADISGNVYTAGYFQGTGDFDPGTQTNNLTSAGGNDIFISKNQFTSSVDDNEGDFQGITVYPNPAGEKLYITGREIHDITLFAVSGVEVMNKSLRGKPGFAELELTGLEPGIYILKVTCNEGFYSKKVIRE